MNEGVTEGSVVEMHDPKLSLHRCLGIVGVSGDFQWATIVR